MSMRPILPACLLIALLLRAPSTAAGSEGNPELTSPVNPAIDYWADATKFWIVENQSILEFWQENAPLDANPAHQACEASGQLSCALTYQNDDEFSFIMGFTANGEPWHVIYNDIQPSDTDPTILLGQSHRDECGFVRNCDFIAVYNGTQLVSRITDIGAGDRGNRFATYHGNWAVGAAWFYYQDYFPPGTVLENIWGADIVREPTPADRITYTPCPVLPVLADKATDCVPPTGVSYTIQGGVRAQLANVTLIAVPANLTLAASQNGTGRLEVANTDASNHLSAVFRIHAPTGWTASTSPTGVHLPPQSNGTVNWTVAAPANAAPGSYNVTFTLDDGYAVKEANVTIRVPDAAGQATAPPQNATAQPPGNTSVSTGVTPGATSPARPSAKTPTPGWLPLLALAAALAVTRTRR